MENKVVLSDFDGTITKHDTISSFFRTFGNNKCADLEGKWRNGLIGSRDCMLKQFSLIENMSEEKLLNFLDSVEIDESFKKFYETAKQRHLKVAIVSDGFDYFIRRILNRHGIDDIEVFTNHMAFHDGKFIMEFPHINNNCKKDSGSCKCKIMKKFKKLYKTVFYVGDGQSDFCVCNKADFLFAKQRLTDYCKGKKIDFIEYETFDDVIKNDRLGL